MLTAQRASSCSGKSSWQAFVWSVPVDLIPPVSTWKKHCTEHLTGIHPTWLHCWLAAVCSEQEAWGSSATGSCSVSRADGKNGRTPLLSSTRFPGGTVTNYWTKGVQNNKESEHIKPFPIPSLCFSCYLETGIETNVPFASRSSWDLRGTVSAWVT